MSTASLSPTDVRVRDAVLEQLEWDPEVDASAIGVTAKNGTVSLTGFIDSYAGKLAAERAAKRVRGVRAVANDIGVRLMLARTDPDIAADAGRALQLEATVPDTVQTVVHGGAVTLTGTVNWLFQRQNAEQAVRHVRGVRTIFNHIVVAGDPIKDVHRRIVHALHRHADLDARQIAVQVRSGVALLTGTVGSWLQREAAEHAAASAPGITDVDNRIAVEPHDMAGKEG